MTVIDADVLVLGGGPGGYTAAIRAGQNGLRTVLVDAEGLGGTCLNRGCIPSKALLHAAEEAHILRAAAEGRRIGLKAKEVEVDLAEIVGWKDGIVARLGGGVAHLLKKAGVTVLNGWGVFGDAKTCQVDTAEGAVTVRAEHVVLAAGGEPAALPGLPFGGAVISSTEALALDAAPERLVIVGAGYIGLELGVAFRKLGAAVTVVETAERILPLYDRALTEPLRKRLQALGVTVHLSTRAMGFDDGQVRLAGPDGTEQDVAADKVLVTVGRRPRLSGWGLEAMAVDLDDRGFIKVDEACRTSTRNVWAIGDLVGEPMLAHKATAQAEVVVERIAGGRAVFDPRVVPAVCYTDPEIVVVGEGPDSSPDLVTASFPFAASGRAMTGNDVDGFVRVVARKADHVLVGVQAVGAGVSELSAEFALAIEMGARLEDVAGVIHAHPTRSEAFLEASLAALERPLHG